MSYAASQIAAGLLAPAPAGTKCQGATPYSGSSFTCGASNGSPADAVHTWQGGHYCGYHSPFDRDVFEVDSPAVQDSPALPAAPEAAVYDVVLTQRGQRYTVSLKATSDKEARRLAKDVMGRQVGRQSRVQKITRR